MKNMKKKSVFLAASFLFVILLISIITLSKKNEEMIGVNNKSNIKISLDSKTWLWSETREGNSSVEPREKDAFVLTFKNDEASFSFSTDCNRGFGSYLKNGNDLSFSNMGSTKMYCEGAQEADFIQMLNEVKSYSFSESGDLVLKTNSGFMVFK